MLYTFTKMHGLGNDFIIIDQRHQSFPIVTLFIQQLSNRRLGIGCDQFIILSEPIDVNADIFMRIFNADGSEVYACGNATRCMGAYLQRQTGKTKHCIQTSVDLLYTTVIEDNIVSVDMGKPLWAWHEIPLSQDVDTLFLPIEIPGMSTPAAISMGNPHLIFFVSSLDAIDLERFGRELSCHPLFPQQTNVELVQILSRQSLRMRVWERGTGITLSCATGACASVVASVKRGLVDAAVTVHLDGGDLDIRYEDTVVMQGTVNFSFDGSFQIPSQEAA